MLPSQAHVKMQKNQMCCDHTQGVAAPAAAVTTATASAMLLVLLLPLLLLLLLLLLVCVFVVLKVTQRRKRAPSYFPAVAHTGLRSCTDHI
jgi:Flp pilus assembly protein TadB